MRKIIVYTSILIVLTLCAIFQSDYFKVEITELVLKNNLDNATAGAALLVNKERYGDGYIVFEDNPINEYVGDVLKKKCDSYVIYIFDDSGKHREYDQNGLVKTEQFIYPFQYVDPQDLETNINFPTIIIEGEIDKEFYRISNLQNKKNEIVRSSMYVVEARK